MSTLPTIALTLTLGHAAVSAPQEFVHPKAPLSPVESLAPSPNVTNGTLFESGALSLAKGQTLSFPDNAVVEEHDGALLPDQVAALPRADTA